MRMNMQGNDLARVLCLAVLFPVLLILLTMLYGMERPLEQLDTHPPQTTPSADVTVDQDAWRVTVLYNGSIQQMELEEYIIGVVLAEMPASFHMEALKSQAIAARTYALKHASQPKPHGVNMICADSGCCQAYIDPMEYISNGGTGKAVEKVRDAVLATAAMVLVYEDQLIDATFFSCSGGTTEDAVQVWGQDIPYLQSVPSPGEEYAPVYEDSKVFTPEEFQKALGAIISGPMESWFSTVTYTESGSVASMRIGGVNYRGTTLRQILGLRSTVFTVSISEGKIIIHTRGFGHRVGMSQYGANAMAMAGSNCSEILSHYYTGATIVQFNAEKYNSLQIIS